MSRNIDPDEAKAMLKKHQPNFDRINAVVDAERNKWQDEIAMLERRVHDVYEMVDLGNGDRIAVRTALSESEMQEFGKLENMKAALEKGDESLSNITYQQIALMTANPLITTEWLEENKDKWPVTDALVVISSFLEGILLKKMGRVRDIQSFLGQ
ncbi:MAG: hypothetical protein LUQ50_06370 [Methanospirillum sp.]|uniref:hypothetical protein n=1 Tax=Methanospirillum sp. TaxID=45200 RepID=UPI0023712227|nr:hypothetical protein [Methanospirillum sp.]MDD1728678.1 hypothetical protein [Methanospirillum sp.]